MRSNFQLVGKSSKQDTLSKFLFLSYTLSFARIALFPANHKKISSFAGDLAAFLDM